MAWPLVSTRVVLLQALAHGEKTLRELIEDVRVRTGGLISLNDFQVFPVLRELESEGLISAAGRDRAYDGNNALGGRPGRYYRIRAAGSRVASVQASAMSGLLLAALRGVERGDVRHGLEVIGND